MGADIFEGKFEWETVGNGKFFCYLRIFGNKHSEMTAVVVSQMVGYPGQSISTGVVTLANRVCEKFAIIPEILIWIEHFPETSGTTEAFDLVSLKWDGGGFTSPQRRRILRDYAEEMVGSLIGDIPKNL